VTTQSDSAGIVIKLLDTMWSSGDLDGAARYIADSYTIHHDPGDPWEGRELTLADYQDRVRTYRQPFPDQRFTVHEILAGDDKVMLAWYWHTTRTDEPLASGATVYYLEDGKICGHWQVTERPPPESA
jgi:predicted SnoaL-like aldol condensation-catalyzing enzyme